MLAGIGQHTCFGGFVAKEPWAVQESILQPDKVHRFTSNVLLRLIYIHICMYIYYITYKYYILYIVNNTHKYYRLYYISSIL